MEYIDGHELKDKIDAGPLPIDETLSIAAQIAEGLQAAHEKGILHRDIKSSNIMLTTKGDVKIMDFGIAKLPGKTKLTKTGSTLGTVAYMSPEQVQGKATDHRSDIWALGVVIYEMLIGQMPFKGDYDQAVMYAIVTDEPEPVIGLRTGVPMELERIVNKCLEKDAADRYQQADDLIVDLRMLKKQSQKGEPTSNTDAQKLSTSKTPALLIPVIIGLALAAGLIGYWFIGREPAITVRIPIVVADMINETGDSELDGLSEMLVSALEQSRRVAVFRGAPCMECSAVLAKTA